MTLPYERTYAVMAARRLLVDLTDPNATPRVPRNVRLAARSVLKHYPTKHDMERPRKAFGALSNQWP